MPLKNSSVIWPVRDASVSVSKSFFLRCLRENVMCVAVTYTRTVPSIFYFTSKHKNSRKGMCDVRVVCCVGWFLLLNLLF